MVYRAADLMIVPSRLENLSLTVLEAMACGTPVIAFDIGGMPDMIESGTNGWLAPAVTSEALLTTIIAALGQPGATAEAGDAARRTIEDRFSLQSEASAMAELYRAVLASPTASGRAAVGPILS